MIDIQVNANNALVRIDNLKKNAADFRKAWKIIHAYMISAITLQFDRLGKGGTDRGVVWPDFKYQYIRSANFKVPAGGGVAKVHNFSELVLGRLRGETKKRVNASSKLLQNDGTLKGALLQKFTATPTKLVMDTADNSKKVAFQNRLRPFQFFEVPRDSDVIRDTIARHLVKGVN